MKWVIGLVRWVVVAVLLWLAFVGLGEFFMLNGDWPLWAMAAVSGLAVEIIWQLYRFERAAVSVRRGRWLVGLRLGGLAVVVWMILEPVWSRNETRDLRREVVVIWDESASMDLQDEGEVATRLELATSGVERSGLREAIGGELRVRELRVARGVRSGGEGGGEGWDEATDLVGALGAVLDQVAPEQLAGVVLVTDGQHNRGGRIEDVARRYGILDAPIGVLAVGSEKPPRDVALVAVEAPDAVFLGDRLRVRALVKVDGYRGEKVKVRLWRGEDVIGEREVVASSDTHREELRFQGVPEAGGVDSYRVAIEALEGERFSENNEWRFETAVTQDRTNVLLIESYPRWEFRYLRNLFYGRDQSIHLQYVLEHPERVLGQEDEVVSASASRSFKDSRATRLPASEEEWRKFDVILLGDVGPEFIGEETWEIIRRCVNERGAMLGVIAGPRSMPHAHRSAAAMELLPVSWTPGEQEYFGAVDDFRLRLTAAGANHPVTAQSESRMENEGLWNGFPVLRWRHPAVEVKAAAEVLIFAGAAEAGERVRPSDAGQLGSVLDGLAARRQEEKAKAVLVVGQAGLGKVAALLTDHTWRLREGAGDVYHHRLWGQLARWGAGPNLRGGAGGARLGTDRLNYTGDDPVTITARLRDEKMAPLMDEVVSAELWSGGQRVGSVPLTAVANSPGLYEAKVGELEDGSYQVVLAGERVAALSAGEPVEASLTVGGQGVPVELAQTTRNSGFLERAAELSGGRVVEADAAGALASLFLTNTVARKELRETRLWDWWPLLVVFCGLVITEWSLRRNAGLP